MSTKVNMYHTFLTMIIIDKALSFYDTYFVDIIYEVAVATATIELVRNAETGHESYRVR